MFVTECFFMCCSIWPFFCFPWMYYLFVVWFQLLAQWGAQRPWNGRLCRNKVIRQRNKLERSVMYCGQLLDLWKDDGSITLHPDPSVFQYTILQQPRWECLENIIIIESLGINYTICVLYILIFFSHALTLFVVLHKIHYNCCELF